MKLLSGLALVAVLAALAVPASAAGVPWIEGEPFADVLARAEAEGKPVIIDFYTVWCGPCKKLDKEVWVDDRVAGLAEDSFIPVKIDCEKGEGIAVAKAHKIFNYPSIVFLKPAGGELDRIVGYRDADAMLAFMEDMAAGRNTTDHLMAATPATSEDLEKVFEVGSRLGDQARKDEATPYLERVLALDADGALAYRHRALLALADLERKTDNFPAAVAYAEQVLEESDDGAVEDEALSSIAYYHKKMKDMDGAASAYRRMIERHPDDPGTLNAFAWFAATNGVALEEATEYALKGVELSGGSAGILDTLAEVYYARGMYGKAIEAIDRALVQDPEDTYFLEQRAKFEAARTGSE